jgi:hypothetical protein
VIRFSLLSDADIVEEYEWVDRTVRLQRKSRHPDKQFFSQFMLGSTHKWNYWALEANKVDRNAVGTNSLLTSPYSMSRDGKMLVAGLQRQDHKIAFEEDITPQSIAFLEASTSKVLGIVDLGRSIDSVSWAPDSKSVAVIARSEKYGSKSVKDKLAASIGHPVPYENIKVYVIGIDGAFNCAVLAALSMPYGTGLIRWEQD